MILPKTVINATIGTSAALNLPPTMSSSSHLATAVVCEGWVLKKRRKKMQGFARRFFTLHHSGLLSYSFEPGQPIRDQISLQHAAISTAPGRRDIHIDSSAATFHIKCLSTEDFDKWMSAFRKFIFLKAEARRSASMKVTSRHGNTNASKTGAILEEMGSTIAFLEESVAGLAHERVLHSKKHHSSSKKSEKEKMKDHGKESRFGLFKKSSHYPLLHEPDTGSSRIEEFSASQAPHPLERVFSALHILKSQHAALLKAVPFENNPSSAHGSPLPFTAEEEEQLVNLSPSNLTRGSQRSSVSTTVSDSVHEWFDALDVAEEFVMDVGVMPDEQPGRILINESRSSFDQYDGSSVDTDEDVGIPPSEGIQVISSPAIQGSQNIVRRLQLPAPSVGDEGSLFAILKKNVGKDLSTIVFPVTFNEPLTLLQRAAEELEYYQLLDQAASTDDPMDRLCFVAAFAVSGYAHTRHRSGRKGFFNFIGSNPMLGETFEDHRMKFIAEKVRHHPLEMAYHAEGVDWELTATSAGRTKFWGKSLEVIPLGVTHLKVGRDHYVWRKPSSFMRNLMVGTKYLEHTGKMSVENTRDKTRCIIDFKQNGYWGASNQVSGTVYGPSGEAVSYLDGKWDDQMAQTLDSSHFRVLWRMASFPKNTHEYYGFTAFGITLNEMTSDLVGKLPPTDSRFRPDVRALENGDLDVAEEEKARLEELQRERRRCGEDIQPRWFKQDGDEWVYNGGYWEARSRNWQGDEIRALW